MSTRPGMAREVGIAHESTKPTESIIMGEIDILDSNIQELDNLTNDLIDKLHCIITEPNFHRAEHPVGLIDNGKKEVKHSAVVERTILARKRVIDISEKIRMLFGHLQS